MNTIDRHVTAYVFGCLSGDFGENFQSTKEILLATEHNPENPFLSGVLQFVKKYGTDDKDVQKAIAETALEYFANPKKHSEKIRALYTETEKGHFFFTVHKGTEVIGMVISNDFANAVRAIEDKYPRVEITDVTNM